MTKYFDKKNAKKCIIFRNSLIISSRNFLPFLVFYGSKDGIWRFSRYEWLV